MSKHLQSGAIVNRIHQPIGIDIVAKPLVSPLFTVAFGDQWRAGKCDAHGIRESLEQVIPQI